MGKVSEFSSVGNASEHKENKFLALACSSFLFSFDAIIKNLHTELPAA